MNCTTEDLLGFSILQFLRSVARDNPGYIGSVAQDEPRDIDSYRQFRLNFERQLQAKPVSISGGRINSECDPKSISQQSSGRIFDLSESGYVALGNIFSSVMLQFAALPLLASEIAGHAPTPGYGPFLEGLGIPRFAAFALGRLAARHGRRVENDARHERRAVRAIKYLMRTGTYLKTRLRHAKELYCISDNTTVLETIFARAGRDEIRFVQLLKNAPGMSESEWDEIREIARSLTGNLSIRRGAKSSAASCAHLFLAKALDRTGKSRKYTREDPKEEFTDPFTRATAQEFDFPRFDPRPALAAKKKSDQNLHN